MKKIIAAVCVLCCLVAVCLFCMTPSISGEVISDNNNYIIKKDNGKTLLQFKKFTIETLNNGTYEMEANILPIFRNLKEMKSNILEGSIDEKYLKGLQRFANEEYVLEICDLDSLSDVRLPNDVTLDHVTWHGKDYSYSIAWNCGTGSVRYLTEDEYYSNALPECSKLDLVDSVKIRYTEYIEDRQANATVYMAGHQLYTNLLYQIVDENRILYVSETYVGGADGGYPPRTIRICGEENGVYFYGFFLIAYDDPAAVRPSVEWLSSFGLTPYVEDASAEVS